MTRSGTRWICVADVFYACLHVRLYVCIMCVCLCMCVCMSMYV